MSYLHNFIVVLNKKKDVYLYQNRLIYTPVIVLTDKNLNGMLLSILVFLPSFSRKAAIQPILLIEQ